MTTETTNKNKKRDSLVGDYLIGEDLGHGTFSKVKYGVNRLIGDKVAIKVIKKANLHESDDLERVKREIEILNNLKHINIIKVYNIMEDEFKYYIVMEYCGGGELFNYIVKNKRLDEDTAAFFFYQLINGLEVIHKYNIAHRDIKPENILLTDNKILKIIDFGLSNKYIEGTLLQTPCGSPCYASPEMVAGKDYNGFMIDIWSSGIVLFAMICGYLPFEDSCNEKLFSKILECRVQYPSFMPSNVKDLLKKMLVTDPGARIKIQEIKQHPFYNQGKFIFNKLLPVKTVSEIKFKLNKTVEESKQAESNLNNFSGLKYKKRGLFQKTFLKHLNLKNQSLLTKAEMMKNVYLFPDTPKTNPNVSTVETQTQIGTTLTNFNSLANSKNIIALAKTNHSKPASITKLNSKTNFIKIVNSKNSNRSKAKMKTNRTTATDFLTTYLNTSIENNYMKTDVKKVAHVKKNISINSNFTFSATGHFSKQLPQLVKNKLVIKPNNTVNDNVDLAKVYLNTTNSSRVRMMPFMMEKKQTNKLNIYNLTSNKLKESLKSALYTKNYL
jgi:serine/threonine protein kinase